MKSELERLEEKGGRIHTTYDFTQALAKAAATPEAVTDEEIAVLGFFGGERAATTARTAREHALHPSVEAPAPVAAPTARGVEFPDQLWDADAPDQVQEMDRWATVNALKTLPLRIWWMFVKAGREKREALAAKVDALEQRVAELESKPSLKYCGVWSASETYHVGDFVTKSGSLWAAKLNHLQSEPGNDNGVGWTLAVKRGRDAR